MRKNYLKIIFVLILSLSPIRGFTNDDGNFFLKSCESDSEAYLIGFCQGYIRAAWTSLSIKSDGKEIGSLLGICDPNEAITEQITKVITLWMNNNPNKLHYPAFKIFVTAMQEGFPCEQQ